MRTVRLASLLVVVASILLLHVASAGEEKKSAKEAPALPRMVDLGADKCIPCKKMAPILKEMKADYAGIVNVEFIDVWKDREAGKPYKIRAIPTQVFFDSTGTEVFRHLGFFSREDIERVFQEKLGITPVPKKSAEAGKGKS